jgi:hypothetical protein
LLRLGKAPFGKYRSANDDLCNYTTGLQSVRAAIIVGLPPLNFSSTCHGAAAIDMHDLAGDVG